MLVGDGISDLAAGPAVDLVVGFGGVVSRPKVAEEAKVFIKAQSLAPVLPLALSIAEQTNLQDTSHQSLLEKGVSLIKNDQVLFRSMEIGNK